MYCYFWAKVRPNDWDITIKWLLSWKRIESAGLKWRVSNRKQYHPFVGKTGVDRKRECHHLEYRIRPCRIFARFRNNRYRCNHQPVHINRFECGYWLRLVRTSRLWWRYYQYLVGKQFLYYGMRCLLHTFFRNIFLKPNSELLDKFRYGTLDF